MNPAKEGVDMRQRTIPGLLVCGAMLGAVAAWADGSPPPAAPIYSSAEQRYADGFDAQKRGDFARAAREYEAAIKLREAYPEAWNGLGFALRQQGKYPEAIRAYERALALRPNYAEALEYLGEAYVRLGRLDDARGVLARLLPLDRAEGQKLQAAIEAKR
jgi:tetratricopeptide (TPR) repeat protein